MPRYLCNICLAAGAIFTAAALLVAMRSGYSEADEARSLDFLAFGLGGLSDGLSGHVLRRHPRQR